MQLEIWYSDNGEEFLRSYFVHTYENYIVHDFRDSGWSVVI